MGLNNPLPIEEENALDILVFKMMVVRGEKDREHYGLQYWVKLDEDNRIYNMNKYYSRMDTFTEILDRMRYSKGGK